MSHLGVVGVVGSNPAAPMSADSTPVVKGARKGSFLLVVGLLFSVGGQIIRNMLEKKLFNQKSDPFMLRMNSSP